LLNAAAIGFVTAVLTVAACGDTEPSVELSILTGNGDGTFSPRISYGTGSGDSTSLAVADFNGDGRLDLAITGYDSSCCYLRVLLGNGDGTFTTKNVYTHESGGWVVVAGDFDGDGRSDLVIVDATNVVSFFHGLGDGTFAAPIDSGNERGANGDSMSAVVGDLNLDGKPDIAFTGLGLPAVLFLGQGDGTFQSSSMMEESPLVVSLAIADLNGDGKPDLVLGGLFGASAAASPAFVQLGNGDGTFQAGASVGKDDGAFAAVVGDFRLGTPAAIVYKEGGTVGVLQGSGDGTFPTQARYMTDQELDNSALEFVDVNDDGVLDVVAPNDEAGVVVLLGNSDGTLQSAQVSRDASLANGTIANCTMKVPLSVVAGDWDADGTLDLAVARGVF